MIITAAHAAQVEALMAQEVAWLAIYAPKGAREADVDRWLYGPDLVYMTVPEGGQRWLYSRTFVALVTMAGAAGNMARLTNAGYTVSPHESRHTAVKALWERAGDHEPTEPTTETVPLPEVTP
jgi:hypothetical protein